MASMTLSSAFKSFLLLLVMIVSTMISLRSQASASRFGQRASSAERQDYVQQAQSLPKKLLSNGYQDILGVDLRKLLNDIESLKWYVTNSPIGYGHGLDLRTCGVFDAKELSVLVMTSCLSMSLPEFKSILFLHESLGALGYQLDENYVLSTSMWMLANNNQRNFKFDERSFLKVVQRTLPTLVTEGGATSVRGGGENVGYEVKAYALLFGLNYVIKNRARYDWLEVILNSQFETLADVYKSHSIKKIKGKNAYKISVSKNHWVYLKKRDPNTENRQNITQAILKQIWNLK